MVGIYRWRCASALGPVRAHVCPLDTRPWRRRGGMGERAAVVIAVRRHVHRAAGRRFGERHIGGVPARVPARPSRTVVDAHEGGAMARAALCCSAAPPCVLPRGSARVAAPL